MKKQERRRGKEEEAEEQEEAERCRAADFFRRGGFPIRQAQGGHGRGRYVVSTRTIKRGEVVLEALPYTLAPKLLSRTCARCLRYHAPEPAPEGRRDGEEAAGQVDDDDGGGDDGGEQDVGLVEPVLWPCRRGCGARYCTKEEEDDDEEAGHGLECAAWRRVRQVGASVGLTEGEQTELRLALRIIARHQAARNAERFHDEPNGDTGGGSDIKENATTMAGHLVEPTFDDVMRLCSNQERRPLEDVRFWRGIVECVMAPLIAEEGGGVPWSAYDIVELIGKSMCNGFGLRGAGGECYGYGIYPAASYFNHSCYPNVCRLDQEANSSPGGSRQSIKFVALVDINEGQEVTLSYIDASKSTEDRRLALSTIYFFHCMCVRCEWRQKKGGRSKQKDDYVQRFVCRSCTKHNGRGVLYPFSPTHDRCNLCHKLVARRNQQKAPPQRGGSPQS